MSISTTLGGPGGKGRGEKGVGGGGGEGSITPGVIAFPSYLTGCVLMGRDRLERLFKKTSPEGSWGGIYARHHTPPLKSRVGGTEP